MPDTDKQSELSDVGQVEVFNTATAHPISTKQYAQHAQLRKSISVFLLVSGLAIWFGLLSNRVHLYVLALSIIASYPVLLALLNPRAKYIPPSAFTTSLTPLQRARLPRYTVLVPLLHEANMLSQLATQLTLLDYPPDKLEVLILMEASDHATRDAAKAMTWPDYCHLITVPEAPPQTKPRACNYGLSLATGKYLVIYDAEDKPRPDQLLQACMAFEGGPDELVCLQSPLLADASQGGWLQRQFATEYRILFWVILPVLSYLSAVIPLGGSSNHFRRHQLQLIGGWDAYNLTEDAELAVRLAKNKFTTQVLAAATIENAPHSFQVWLKQRTRWFTGHIQTLHLHMANPLRDIKLLGPQRYALAVVLFAGRILIGLGHLFFTVFFITYLLRLGAGEVDLDAAHFTTAETIALLGYLSFVITFSIVGYINAPPIGFFGKLFIAMTQSFYWLLTSLALLVAAKRIYAGQLNWLKTPHRPYAENHQPAGPSDQDTDIT